MRTIFLILMLFSQILTYSQKRSKNLYILSEKSLNEVIYLKNGDEFFAKLIIYLHDNSFEFYYANTDMILKYSYGKISDSANEIYILNSDTVGLKEVKNISIYRQESRKKYSFLFFTNARFKINIDSLEELEPYTPRLSHKNQIYVKDILQLE